MQICRFVEMDDAKASPRVGLLDGDVIHDVTAVTQALPALHWPLPPGDHFIARLPQLMPLMQASAPSARAIPRAAVRLLSPVANPGKIVCGVANWRHQGAPLGMLGFLFKVTSAISGEGDGLRLSWPDRTTVYEAELAIVIGKQCRNVSENEALDYIAGYCGALDMTMKEEREFHSFCKSFDTYGILGPSLVTTDELRDTGTLSYTFSINGEVVDERNFADLTANAAQLVAYASSAMTLHPGDVIMTGAAQVGPVVAGDVMTLDIVGLGSMTVRVSLSPNARLLQP